MDRKAILARAKKRRLIFRKLLDQGVSFAEIGRKYKMTGTSVSHLMNGRPNFKKLKPQKVKTYIDYLKESDYSSRLKSIYIKNYANFTTEESV